jgi:hypothetical protein
MPREIINWSGATGRDEGKTYVISETDPFYSFQWGMKAAKALAGLLPENYPRSIDGVAMWAAESGIDKVLEANPAELLPLLDELFYKCVKYQSPANEKVTLDITPDYNAGRIEERNTIAELYLEIFKVHTNFYGAE